MLTRWKPRAAFAALSYATVLWPRTVSAASVNVALEASFNTPPFLLELLETAALENSSAYFPLLDRIAEGRFAEFSTDKELYDAFLRTLRQDQLLATPDALSTFEMAVSIHAAAPRIEAQYQYYQTSVEPQLPAAQDAACPVWVHYDGKQYCSPTLERAQQDFVGKGENGDLPFDHSLSLSPDLPIATLYMDIHSSLFGQFHQELSEKARSGRLSYRVRYRPSSEPSAAPLSMSGYGVELALKRTDYIVIDDRGADDTTISPDGNQSADQVTLNSEQLDDLKPLSSSQLSGLPLKTSSFIMNSVDPFDALEKVSQDFPKYSFAIANTNATDEFITENKYNRKTFLGPGYNVIWMNGLQIDARSMDAFALLGRLREERKLVQNMKDVGLTAPEAISLLSHQAVTESKTGDDVARYDYRDSTEGGQSIIWLNNIEKDKRYAEWPVEAAMLLQPTYPGQMPSVRRDIHNVVVPVDLANTEDIEEVVNLQVLVRRLIPVRFGFVPTTTSPESQRRARIAYYMQEKYGLGVLMDYLQVLSEDKQPQITQSKIEKYLQDQTLRPNREPLPIAEVLEGVTFTERVDATQRYLKRLGASDPAPPVFVNGFVVPRNDAWMQAMSTRISYDMQMIQQKIYEGTLSEEAWIAEEFLEGASISRNALIIPNDEESEKIVDIGTIVNSHRDLVDSLPKIKASEEALKQFWSYTLVVADLDSPAGVKLVASAVEWRKSQPEAEIIILHNKNPSNEANPVSSAFFDGVSREDTITLESLDKILQDGISAPADRVNEMADTFWTRMQLIVQDIGLKPGDNALILNGRVIGPVTEDVIFDSDAFSLLLNYEQKKRITPVTTALVDLRLEDRLQSPFALARVTSMMALAGKSHVPEGIFANTPLVRMNLFSEWQSNHTGILIGDTDTSLIQIVASIEPSSEVAQRWIPILRVLSQLDGVSLKLFLNPRDYIKELPIKRFYRHVLGPKIEFDDEGHVKRRRASFEGLPQKALLNFGMDLPPAWLVSPKESRHDLDNIKLSSLKGGQDVDAIYELEHILIEGHSRDASSGQPPRGAQLWLGSDKDEQFADTLIMANLGYFQFKANPGHWNIQLKPGRSQEVFHIDNIGANGYSKEIHKGRIEATLMSFQGLTLYPTLSRNSGHETDDVLEGGLKAGSAGAYVAKASNFASGFLSNVGLGKKSKHADINIFSVASGHLYERMLNIMMVSVMRHTKHTVKFWFIEQFLSPSFKKTLPAVAKEYNFDYEMVTYKWPHWLRGQKEKQREIWGYKILFLDVLFPLSLDKVIFVDADQIVRTDMYELVTHDLQGAPYGFTPMCDSRTEMEGFRFWKQGYWKNFLRGLPYHISALYVVDLKRFRQMAAGDRLRQQYHTLSADPNSLSNLDQDLPNNMQSMLPIHSLPQEWLWCETWCSDESLKDAKTIDLCNNPQTFEPKLDRARRQVPEWTVYDNEIAEVIKRSNLADETQSAENVQEELDKKGDQSMKEDTDSSTGSEKPHDSEPNHSIKDEL